MHKDVVLLTDRVRAMHYWRGNPGRSCGTGAASITTATVVAVALLLGAGVAYRLKARDWRMDPNARIELPIPLKNIPYQIGTWVGQDLELDAATRAYMERNFADDYISRRYVSASERFVADAYIVYCSSRLAGILGHNPQVCYPGNGYVWDGTEPSQFVTGSGWVIDCLIHRFHKPTLDHQSVYVLNFYVLNGRVTLREREFSGWSARKLNFTRYYGRYVAQIQISSVSENAVRALASQMTDIILSFLPDERGEVEISRTMEAPMSVGGAVETGV